LLNAGKSYFCNIVAFKMKVMLISAGKSIVGAVLLGSLIFYSGCKSRDPEPENIPELITKLTLRFTPAGGGPVVIVTATDPDGEGVQDLQVDGPITLVKGTSYNLSLELINGLYDPTEDGYNITKEIEEEANEHQFFFATRLWQHQRNRLRCSWFCQLP
jgi:hypothetical protein